MDAERAGRTELLPARDASGGRPRVVHVALAHDPFDVRIFEKEARALAAAGYDVVLAAPGAVAGESDGVTFCPLPETASRRGILAAPQRIAAVAKALHPLGAAVWHIHEPELAALALHVPAGWPRLIYDAHEDAPVEALSINAARPLKGRVLSLAWRAALAYMRRRFDGFVAATPAIAATLPADRTVVVRNYPDLSIAPGPRPFAERPPVVAYVGTIMRSRGLFTMLEVLDRLPKEDPTRLLLVGAFRPSGLEAEARRHPGWKRVDFFGWSRWADVLERLDDVRAGWLPLHQTPETVTSLPVKLFEYMAKGLPVLLTENAMWREMAGAAAVSVPEDDAAAMQETLRDLLGDPLRAQELGRQGRERLVAHYSWQSQVPALLGLYARCVALPVRSRA